MADNDFILEEALVNQNFKKAIELYDQKLKSGTTLTKLEHLYRKYMHLNVCLAELLGPLEQKSASNLRGTLNGSGAFVSQFPEFRRVYHAIKMQEHFKMAHGSAFTPVEEAFMRYFQTSADAGRKIAEGDKDADQNS